MTKPKTPIAADWWSKTLAGAVLGLTLAFALAGLLAWWGPDGIAARDKTQAVMWSIAWFWLPVFALVYCFRSGARALLWLGAANVLAYGLLWWARGS